MKTILFDDKISKYVEASKTEPIAIIRDGRPIAFMIAAPEASPTAGSLSDFEEMLSAAEKRIKQSGGLSHDVFWQMVERDDPKATTELV